MGHTFVQICFNQELNNNVFSIIELQQILSIILEEGNEFFSYVTKDFIRSVDNLTKLLSIFSMINPIIIQDNVIAQSRDQL